MYKFKDNPLKNSRTVSYIPISIGENNNRAMMFSELLDEMKDGEIRRVDMDLDTATRLNASAQYIIEHKKLPYEWECWRRRLSYLSPTDRGILYVKRIKFLG